MALRGRGTSQEGAEENEGQPAEEGKEEGHKDVGKHAGLHAVDAREILSASSTTTRAGGVL